LHLEEHGVDVSTLGVLWAFEMNQGIIIDAFVYWLGRIGWYGRINQYPVLYFIF